MSRLARFGAKAIIALNSLQFEEALVLRLLGGPGGRVVALGDLGHLGQVDVPFAVEVLAGVVIPHLMLGRV